jgi:hypothetical protein
MKYNINLIKSVSRHWRKPSRTTLDAIASQNPRTMLIDGRRTPRNANYVGYEADRAVKRKAQTLAWKRLTQTLHSAVWRHVARETGKKWSLVGASRGHKCAVRKLVTIIVATLALATSAMAKIGETYAQVKSEAQQDRDTVSMSVGDYYGRTLLQVQYRNGDAIRHLFGSNGREIAFYWRANHNVTDREIGIVMRIFKTRWYAVRAANPQFLKWESANGLVMVVDSNFMSIFDQSRISEVPAPSENDDPQQSAPPVDKKDCLIIATEAFARLSKTSQWARIVKFTLNKDGKPVTGHAACLYQPNAGSNVYMYDQDLGSLNLQTESHELSEIAPVLSQVSRVLGGYSSASRAEWIGAEGGVNVKPAAPPAPALADNSDEQDDGADRGLQRASKAELAEYDHAHATATPPGVTTTNPSIEAKIKAQNADVQHLAVQVAAVIFLLIWVGSAITLIVICFMKGKPVFGAAGILCLFISLGGPSLWCLIGAIRIAKPYSWWARKYYVPGKKNGHEKMLIAIERFTNPRPKTAGVTATAPVAVPPPMPAAMTTATSTTMCS